MVTHLLSLSLTLRASATNPYTISASRSRYSDIHSCLYVHTTRQGPGRTESQCCPLVHASPGHKVLKKMVQPITWAHGQGWLDEQPPECCELNLHPNATDGVISLKLSLSFWHQRSFFSFFQWDVYKATGTSSRQHSQALKLPAFSLSVFPSLCCGSGHGKTRQSCVINSAEDTPATAQLHQDWSTKRITETDH